MDVDACVAGAFTPAHRARGTKERSKLWFDFLPSHGWQGGGDSGRREQGGCDQSSGAFAQPHARSDFIVSLPLLLSVCVHASILLFSSLSGTVCSFLPLVLPPFPALLLARCHELFQPFLRESQDPSCRMGSRQTDT